jgi:hypothetical protein
MDSKIKIILSVFLFFLTITINAQDKKVMKIAKYIEKGKGTEAKELLDELDSKKEYQSDIYYWYVRTVYYRNAALANTNSQSELAEARKSFEKLVEFDKNDPSKSFTQYIPQIKKDLYEGKNQMTKSGSSSQSGAVNQANDGKSVTLTQIGQGKTKDAAKYNALRNAIEKAFGTFISSNTTLLNDELVKDEIVSVSTGNIQDYEILSETQMPDGSFSSVVKATVSIGKLTKFCESKGISVEFKGGLFAANIKLQELNKKNEEAVMANLFTILNKIVAKGFDFKIDVSEPKQKYLEELYEINYLVYATPNDNLKSINQIIINVLNGICLTQDEISDYQNQNRMIYRINVNNKSYSFRSSFSLVYLLTIVDRKTPLASLNFEIMNDKEKRTCLFLLEKNCISKANWTPPKWNYSSPSVDKIAIYKNIIAGEYLSYDEFSLLKVKSSNYNELSNSYTSYNTGNTLPKILLENLYNGYEILYQFKDVYNLEDISKITEYKVQTIIK